MPGLWSSICGKSDCGQESQSLPNQPYVNQKYTQLFEQLEVEPKGKGSLKVQMDELWSFYDHKGNKQCVWLGLDVEIREIIGCQIGEGCAG